MNTETWVQMIGYKAAQLLLWDTRMLRTVRKKDQIALITALHKKEYTPIQVLPHSCLKSGKAWQVFTTSNSFVIKKSIKKLLLLRYFPSHEAVC